MRKLLATLLTVAVAAAFVPTLSDAASSCPPEVAQAKDLLARQTAASRTLAGAREVQAPRMQDVQAPKMQDVQAPRDLAAAAEIKHPRPPDFQASETQDAEAIRMAAMATGHPGSPASRELRTPAGPAARP